MDKKLIPFSLRLPSSVADDLEKLADRSGMTKGELLRHLVEEALAARAGEGEPADAQSANVPGLLESIAQKVDESSRLLAKLATQQAELAALPDQLERLAGLLTKLVAAKTEGGAAELDALREQIARMLAMLHAYRTNGSDEDAAGFARQIFQ